MPHFECGAFDLSATSPRGRCAAAMGAGGSEAGRLADALRLAKPFRRANSGNKAGAPLVSGGRQSIFVKTMDRAHFFSPQAGKVVEAPPVTHARFAIGDVVRHRLFDFRGVVFDVDPVFANSEDWYNAIPAEVRPHREQPFYHLLAENSDSSYVAYVS